MKAHDFRATAPGAAAWGRAVNNEQQVGVLGRICAEVLNQEKQDGDLHEAVESHVRAWLRMMNVLQ